MGARLRLDARPLQYAQCFILHAPRTTTYLALFAKPALAMMLRRFLAKWVTGNALEPAVSIERNGIATRAKEMAVTQLSSVLRYIHRIKEAEEASHLSDERLLARFIADRDEGAFTALVKRHCSMVMGICRRILADHHQAEDAAQAAFFVLARKAASIRYRKTVASWLYGVAVRTAMKARARVNLHPLEPLLFEISAPDCRGDPLWNDLRPVLDQEINRLPEKYLKPFVLCYLQNKTNAAAAMDLNCPEGTVVTRLARARARLRQRLSQRGITLSIGALGAALDHYAVPTVVSAQTIRTLTTGALQFRATA